MISACWHVHGDFFDALFKIQPNAVVQVSAGGETRNITIDGGNWQDMNIGSEVYPLMMSTLCGCYNDIDELKKMLRNRYL
jgi:hypothetical protein